MSAAEIDKLVKDKDVTQLCPFYLDLQGEGQRLQVPNRSWRHLLELLIIHQLCSMPFVAPNPNHPSVSALHASLRGVCRGHAARELAGLRRA